MTPEREKQIREWPYTQTPPEMMWEASRELLAELDRVRTVAAQQAIDNAFKCGELRKERDSYKEENESLRLIPELREKLEIAVEALAFYSTNDIHNYNFDYKDNGQRACEAILKIRGEK